MPFHITCVCGHLTIVPDESAGQIVRCAQCDAELPVPEIAGPTPPPAPEVTLPRDAGQNAGDADQHAGRQPMIVVRDTRPTRHALADPRRKTIVLLAAGMAVLAWLSILPIVVASASPAAGAALRTVRPVNTETWSLAIILIALLHLVYILYLVQLPDVSSVRVVSYFLLVISTLYAITMAVRLFADDGNAAVRWLGLDGNTYSSNQETLWCFLMVMATGTLSYLAGRAASRWPDTDSARRDTASQRASTL